MKTYKLTNESSLKLVERLGEVKRFSEFTVAELLDPKEIGITEDTLLFLGEEGRWQWRTVGDSYSHTEIDSTIIAGPLTHEEHEAVYKLCEEFGTNEVELNALEQALVDVDLN